MSATVNPLLLDFPEEIETERLLIRMPRPGDGPALNAAVNASLDHLRPWMPWATHIPTVDESETLVRQGMARWLARQDLWLMIVRKRDGKWLGGSGLHRINWDVPRVEIGYWIRPDEEGHGYVSEAVQAIAAFAFDKLGAERVEIRCDARNRRSAAVAQRCGFRLEGRLRHHARDTAGQVNDDLIFSRLRTDPPTPAADALPEPELPATQAVPTTPPLLLDIPTQLESERLVLRVPRAGDGLAIYEAVAESQENLRPWLPFARETPAVANTETFARRSAVAFLRRESLNLLLFRKSDGRFVGVSGFNQHLDWHVPRFEIGYWVRTSEQGQGYISEAVRTVTDFAFRDLHALRVAIHCDAANTRSAAVARRCGFTQEARLRNQGRNGDGALNDELVFSKLRSEWEAGERA